MNRRIWLSWMTLGVVGGLLGSVRDLLGLQRERVLQFTPHLVEVWLHDEATGSLAQHIGLWEIHGSPDDLWAFAQTHLGHRKRSMGWSHCLLAKAKDDIRQYGSLRLLIACNQDREDAMASCETNGIVMRVAPSHRDYMHFTEMA